MAFLDRSECPRDIENDGSRFWSIDVFEWTEPFDGSTVGIVDENEGGIVVYCHENNADRVIEAFRAFTGEV